MRNQNLFMLDEIELLEILELIECLGIAVSSQIRKRQFKREEEDRDQVEYYKEKLRDTVARRSQSLCLEPF